MKKETGFPSPAQGYETEGFDFNRLLLDRRASTFVMRLESRELVSRGIPPGSLLIVDRAADPRPGDLAVFCHEGGFLCRELVRTGPGREAAFLGDAGRPIRMEDGEIFGTVMWIVRRP